MQENPTKRPYSVELAASLISLALIIALMYVLQSVLLPLMFSILIAMSLYPVAIALERLRLGKAFSALLAVILAIAVLSGLVWFIVHQVIVIGRDGTDIQHKFLTIFDTIQRWLQERFGIEPTEVVERLRGQANQILSNAASYITA